MPATIIDTLGLEGAVEGATRDALANALRGPWPGRIHTAGAGPTCDDPSEIGTPAIIVMAGKEEQDPPKTNMWRCSLRIDVRASLHETSRAEVSAVMRLIEDAIECSLKASLTTDTIHCADVEYDSPWERDVDGPILTHRVVASVWAFRKITSPIGVITGGYWNDDGVWIDVAPWED